jgi:hypothetical protein
LRMVSFGASDAVDGASIVAHLQARNYQFRCCWPRNWGQMSRGAERKAMPQPRPAVPLATLPPMIAPWPSPRNQRCRGGVRRAPSLRMRQVSKGPEAGSCFRDRRRHRSGGEGSGGGEGEGSRLLRCIAWKKLAPSTAAAPVQTAPQALERPAPPCWRCPLAL